MVDDDFWDSLWYVQFGREKGVECPCCGQFAKVYKRKINRAMAKALIAFYRAGSTVEWVHGPTLLRGARADEGKLRYWGLLEEQGEKRPDGGRAGYWRVTKKGERFIQGRTKVPEYARVYDSLCLGFEGQLIGIEQALGERFDLAELMAS